MTEIPKIGSTWIDKDSGEVVIVIKHSSYTSPWVLGYNAHQYVIEYMRTDGSRSSFVVDNFILIFREAQ